MFDHAVYALTGLLIGSVLGHFAQMVDILFLAVTGIATIAALSVAGVAAHSVALHIPSTASRVGRAIVIPIGVTHIALITAIIGHTFVSITWM